MKPITLTPAQRLAYATLTASDERQRMYRRAAGMWRACARRIRLGRDMMAPPYRAREDAYQRLLSVLP